MTNEALLKRRQEGELPVIKIAGDDFLVNWKSKELVLQADHRVRIHLGSLMLTGDGRHYGCCYHLPTKKVVVLKDNITRLPADTVYLLIPNEKILDPVGVAREFGLADTALLPAYPICTGLEAVVISLEQSPWAEKVKQNLAGKKINKWRRKPGRKGNGI